METFVRQENIRHFQQILSQTKTDAERDKIKKLLAEEERKQIEAGDCLARDRSDTW